MLPEILGFLLPVLSIFTDLFNLKPLLDWTQLTFIQSKGYELCCPHRTNPSSVKLIVVNLVQITSVINVILLDSNNNIKFEYYLQIILINDVNFEEAASTNLVYPLFSFLGFKCCNFLPDFFLQLLVTKMSCKYSV